jgi:hypothetical protein
MKKSAEERGFDDLAYKFRTAYRRHLRGLPPYDGCAAWNPAYEQRWKRDPKDWAWLNAPKDRFVTLSQLRDAIKKAGVKATGYGAEQKLHDDWPSAPHSYYKGKGWVSWDDLFGRAKRLTLPQLKEALKKAGIVLEEEYRAEYRLHEDWPSSPHSFYSEWVSWFDLTGRKKPTFLTLPQLKKATKKAGVIRSRGAKKYRLEQKLHDDWPSTPDQHYKDWVSWTELLT